MKKIKRCNMCCKRMKFSKEQGRYECANCGFPDLVEANKWKERQKLIPQIRMFRIRRKKEEV